MLTPKQLLRKKISRLKQSLPEETIADLSLKIGERLVQTDLFLQSKCIALYYEIDNEVRTSNLIDTWSHHKIIVLPVVDGGKIHFYPYNGKENLKTGAYGIQEPVDAVGYFAASDIDLFVIPGIAFDDSCNRLGRGKGYYDNYLSGVDKPVIGLCYDFQLVDRIPTDMRDKKMTMVITESAIVSPHHQ